MSTQVFNLAQTAAVVVAGCKQTATTSTAGSGRGSSSSFMSFPVPPSPRSRSFWGLRQGSSRKLAPAAAAAGSAGGHTNNNESATGRGFRVDQQGSVYRQSFLVRSFDVDWEQKATVASLMRFMQDSALNHVSSVGIVPEGFALTPYMVRNNLGWVVTSVRIVVDRYPSWRDALQVETWGYPAGKNGFATDWVIRNEKTGEVFARATNICVMMDKKTRRLHKFVEQVKDEFASHLMPVSEPILARDDRRISKLNFDSADDARTGLKPGWCDLDINKHVNNTAYVAWIMESVPMRLVEGYELGAMTVEFRKECTINNVVNSLSKLVAAGNDNGNGDGRGGVEVEHLLCLEDGSEVLRARTAWNPKS